MSSDKPEDSRPRLDDAMSAGYSRVLHWTAILTTLATFPLIFMGGLVTSNNAGMSVPNWPNSFEYSMFTLPWHIWRAGGVFYEHTHRLLGTLVGFLAIILTIVAWRVEKRRWARWLATSVLFAVCFQGILGGLRVIHNSLDLAIVHACVAQAFFCLSGATVVVTSRWWVGAVDAIDQAEMQRGRQLVRLGITCCVLIFVQLIFGALVRHYNAGLAIPDFPLHYGSLVPPYTGDELEAANNLRVNHWGLAPVDSLGAIWLHYAHRMGALVVTIFALNLIIRTCRHHGRHRTLHTPAVIALVLLIAQVTLGAMTVLYWADIKTKPTDIATLHVAVGALLLLTTFILTLRGARLYWPGLQFQAPAPTQQSPAGWPAATATP